EGRRDRLQDRGARRRPRQGPRRRASVGRRALTRALRVPLAGPVRARARPGDRARLPRRDAARRGREARALLLDVWPAVLLDEDHRGGARLRGGQGARGRASPGRGDAREARGVRARFARGQLLIWCTMASTRTVRRWPRSTTNRVSWSHWCTQCPAI